MLEDISIVFLILALLAEIIGTVGGFGSSVFFVPLAAFYFDFQTVLGLTAVFHLSSNISKIGLFRKGIDIGIKDEVMDIYDTSDNFKNSKDVYKKIIQIPLYYTIKEKDIKKISKELNKLYELYL